MKKSTISTMIFVMISAGFTLYLFISSMVETMISKAVSIERATGAAKMNQMKRKHVNEVAKIKARHRAEKKLHRTLSVLPVIGIGAVTLLEKKEFDQWKEENPEGTLTEYTKEIASTTSELLSEEYSDFKGYLDGRLGDLMERSLE